MNKLPVMHIFERDTKCRESLSMVYKFIHKWIDKALIKDFNHQKTQPAAATVSWIKTTETILKIRRM